MFGNDKNALRQMYADAWQRAASGAALSSLDEQIVAVIREHPEYQDAIAAQQAGTASDDAATANAFMHMGLHLGVREQVATDRPRGIRAIWQQLATALGDAHDADHRVGEVLAATLATAQTRGEPPNDEAYLAALRQLATADRRHP